ncbi:MAG: hypothetical protein R3F30_10310 [Planctomycetota bacterium]
MKGMVKGMALAVGGLLLFGGSVLGFLHLSGRLDDDGLRSLPLVGEYLVQDEPAPAPGGIQAVDASASRSRAVPQGAGQDGKRAADADRLHRRTIFDFKSFEAFDPPTTREEIVEFHRLSEEGLARLRRDEALLERRRYELDLVESDLEERRLSLDKLMAEVRAEKEKLEAAYDRFKASFIEMQQGETARFKKQSSVLALMEPKNAAEHLLEMLPAREEDAVKLLTLMEPAAASEILSQINPDKGAQLILRATRLIQKQD